MLSVDAKGVFPIAPTPFVADGAIDRASIDRMIDHYVAAGADGCTILGIMGEAPKLEHDEAVGIVAQCVARAPKLPFVVGVSAPGFAAMRALSHAAMAKGAAGVMIAPPPSLRTDDQIVTYYSQAVEAIGADIPFVIQDYPLALGVVMTPNVIRRIITDNSSCVMLKHEDWPGLEKISALRRFEKEGKLRRVPILTGNGGLFLDFEMERGADGAMTGYAFPEMLIGVVRLSNEGKREEAHDLLHGLGCGALWHPETPPLLRVALAMAVLGLAAIIARPLMALGHTGGNSGAGHGSEMPHGCSSLP